MCAGERLHARVRLCLSACGRVYVCGRVCVWRCVCACAVQPGVFYMKGVPWIANWMWQAFSGFAPVAPPASVFTVPDECAAAVACPGWG